MAQTSDPRWAPPKHLSWVDQRLLRTVRDERDLIFPQVALRITGIVLPLAVLMVLLPTRWMLLFELPYIAFVFTQFTGRFSLMCHALMHRPTFKKEFAWVQTWIFWGLGPLFGATPTSFNAHHVGMHHPENNLATDLSCTLPYQRDQFTDWLHYWARFFFPGLLHLVRYLRLRGRDKLARQLIIGELSWVGFVIALAWIDPAGAIGVVVVPFLLLRVLLMCGNFAQHAFVDIDDPANPYRNSTCIINTRYNHKCYNDGYHIVHHLKPNLHWSEMAQWYDDRKDEFARQDAIVFDGLQDNLHVFVLLMTHDYDTLAAHLVDFHGRTKDEKIAFLKGRVQRRLGEKKGIFAFEPAI